jgi:hypothetical protein
VAEVKREVWVREDANGDPQHAALWRSRLEINAECESLGHKAVRYVPAEDAGREGALAEPIYRGVGGRGIAQDIRPMSNDAVLEKMAGIARAIRDKAQAPDGYDVVVVVTDPDGKWVGLGSTVDPAYTDRVLFAALHATTPENWRSDKDGSDG